MDFDFHSTEQLIFFGVINFEPVGSFIDRFFYSDQHRILALYGSFEKINKRK